MSEQIHQKSWLAWTLFIASMLSMGYMLGANSSQPNLAVARGNLGLSDGQLKDMSQAFREAANHAIPGAVTIETSGRAPEMTNQMDMEDLFERNPFLRDFFESNPNFRGFQNSQPQQRRRQPMQRGQGSGFVYDVEGHIVTNSHVVSGAEKIEVRMHDGRIFDATLIGTDPRADVAVIKIDPPSDLKTLPIGNSDNMEIGDWVLAVGSPFGFELTVTSGIISAKSRGPHINDREDYLQTDAAINPGNSGGPLVNLNGEVVGINTAISTRSGGYDGVGFAIPINMAEWSIKQLIKTGVVKRSYIGVAIQAVTREIAQQLNIEDRRGAIVTKIWKESPAAKSGLQTGDVILNLDGKVVNSTNELQGIVEQLQVDQTYDLIVLRNGSRKTLKITMAEMPEDYSLAMTESPTPEKPRQQEQTEWKEFGLHVQELSPALSEQLGLDSDVQGVVVTSVDDDSPAFEAGLNSGDIIEKVASTAITNLKDFEAAVKGSDPQAGVLLLVRTGTATRFVPLKVAK